MAETTITVIHKYIRLQPSPQCCAMRQPPMHPSWNLLSSPYKDSGVVYAPGLFALSFVRSFFPLFDRLFVRDHPF